MALLPIEDALARLLDGAEAKPNELVPLARAAGRVLGADIAALRTQPPFDASAMDGYAVCGEDVATLPATLEVIGVAAAGAGFTGVLGRGQAVRIFTGAPVPDGADTVVIQENTEATGSHVVVRDGSGGGRNIRRAGLDFREGDGLLRAGRVLDPAALALAASANHPRLPVVGRPVVAVLATGDELVLPGADLGPDQIVASNSFGVAAAARAAGAEALDLGIAADTATSIAGKVEEAISAGADVLVTIGGASVGDHDLVRGVLTDLGMDLAFWKIAMRPGKPLMFGRLNAMRCLGLPGNPVASLVCAQVFLRPLLARLAGRDHTADLREAKLGAPMAANDVRQDYVRATVTQENGGLVATPFPVQDSSMLKLFAEADALIVRPVEAPAAKAGDACRILMLQ
jgi:molybdopterin molybdotransferase